MSYARLSRRPLLFKSFTGLAVSEFDVIAKEIESKYDEHERKRLSNRKRKRDIGAGRPFKLKAKERFLMLLLSITDCTLPLHYQDFYLILTRVISAEIYPL